MSKLYTNRSGHTLTGAERTAGAYVNRGADLPPGFVPYDRPAPQAHPVAHTVHGADTLQALAAELGSYAELGAALRLAVAEHERTAGADLPPGFKAYTSA